MSGKANQYANTVTTTGATGIDFGFLATHLRLANDAGIPVRFTLESTSASTGDAELKALEGFAMEISPTAGMGVTTTSTEALNLRVLALGG